MMENPILLVDTWEGGGEIDEEILISHGVLGMVVRLNDISGGHHMDAGFQAQWEQASHFPVRIPYFVYNPWVAGRTNFDWLKMNAPSDAGAVMLDVEVPKLGYSPQVYADEVELFCNLVQEKWNCMVYTGEWFLPYLSHWPQDMKYWWAQYPILFYPPTSMRMTWSDLKDRLLSVNMPANTNMVPGELGMWQFTGDRLIMEGCEKKIDVNLFYGDERQLVAFASNGVYIPPVADELLEEHRPMDGMVIQDRLANLPRGHVYYHVAIVETEKFDFFVSPAPLSRDYVPNYVGRYNLDLAVNGDGWTSPNPTSILMAGLEISKGNLYGQMDTEETIFIDRSNRFSFTRPAAADLWMAISFPNRIVKDGVVPPINKALDDIRARTAFGFSRDQKQAVFILVDGGDLFSTTGMNFPETARKLIDFGCWQGVMLDGGGSTTGAVAEEAGVRVFNIPYGEDSVMGLKMRRVANVLGVIRKSIVVPPSDTGDDDMTTTKKGTAKVFTRVKYMDGSGVAKDANGVDIGLQIGDWVLGNPSATGEDLVDVVAVHRAAGAVIPLSKPCKVWAANLTIIDYLDGATPPPPTGETIMVMRASYTHEHIDPATGEVVEKWVGESVTPMTRVI